HKSSTDLQTAVRSPKLGCIWPHERRAPQELLDGPAIVIVAIAHILAGEFDQESPPERCKQGPFFRLKWRNLGIAIDHVVVLAAPGKREVANPMIPVGQLKIKNARKPAIEEAQVPGRKIAMNNHAGPAM